MYNKFETYMIYGTSLLLLVTTTCYKLHNNYFIDKKFHFFQYILLLTLLYKYMDIYSK